MAKNDNLKAAKNAKNDEFYTQYDDIQKEVNHYVKHFENKVILCNCDDPKESQFFKFFLWNFHQFKLKKLICTCYKNSQGDIFMQGKGGEVSCKFETDGSNFDDTNINEFYKNFQPTKLQSDGDFRNTEIIELLKEADIVITNPPFSLFREYIAQLIEYDKKFLVIGSQNAITYKEIFPLIKDNKIWGGFTKVNHFLQPNKTIKTFGNIQWFTNLEHSKRYEKLYLIESIYNKQYLKYDNYDAINVDKVCDIPKDYDGVMGVPITFLDKYNPEQFEILNANDFRISESVAIKSHGLIKDKEGAINGKPTYVRILIKRK